ncbi:MAG: MBL fold metallo-hydrolase [Patescibacteria group bacterium]
MVITPQGGSYFKIQSGSFTLLLNPTNARSFKGANVILHTTTPPPMSPPEDEEGTFWIENAGEYEIGGVRIEGWNAGFEQGSVVGAYRIQIEEIEVGILGPVTANPTAEVIEELGEVDILILPTSDVVGLVRQIEPGIVIPYNTESGDYKKFFAELGQSPAPEEKLVIKKKEITPGKIRGVWLKT